MKFFHLLFFTWVLNFSLQAQTNFENQAVALGIDTFSGNVFLGNGICFVDFDNDGWDDITLNTEDRETIRFYKNVNGNFVEQVINLPGINYQTKQVNWVDIDNDGDKDLFITSDTDGNKLFKNNGDLTFTDITVSTGIPTRNLFTYGASWGDYNNDGYLDVYISNRDESYLTANFLFRNNGDYTFTDVSAAAGLHTTGEMSFCSAFFDFDNDGWQDIYVSNDRYFHANFLYRNNGDGTFSDVSVSSGTGISIDAMSTTIDDFNSDGWQDIYITNTSAGNVLFKNNRDGTFTDIAARSGTLFNSIGWGAVFLDAECDMDLDLYVSGMLDGSNPDYISAAFYKNQGDETFVLSQDVGFVGDNLYSFSNAIGDVNNDGLPDIAVSNNNNENMFLWKNLTLTSNNWLKVKLEGTTSNKDGIGSRIEISINGNKQYRYTHCGEGYLSQSSSSEFFGLGTNSVVDYVQVTWLSGLVDIFYNVASNQLLSILEGSNPLSVNDFDLNNTLIYPNPVTNILQIDSENEIQKINIYDILGKRIKSIVCNSLKNEINLSTLNLGMYTLEIHFENNIQRTKIIKK